MRTAARIMEDVLVMGGAMAIVGGIWLIHPPSAVIAGGVVSVGLAIVVKWWRGQPIGRKIPRRGANE